MNGNVYFIAQEGALHGHVDSPLVKIGFTSGDPLKRLKTFEGGSPVTLELLTFIEGTQRLERAFHVTFSRLWTHREWFLLDAKLFAFLDRLAFETAGQIAHKEAVTTALIDAVASDVPAHPSWTKDVWVRSGDIGPLRRFFPGVCRV